LAPNSSAGTAQFCADLFPEMLEETCDPDERRLGLGRDVVAPVMRV
jgi:hypothetical protein